MVSVTSPRTRRAFPMTGVTSALPANHRLGGSLENLILKISSRVNARRCLWGKLLSLMISNSKGYCGWSILVIEYKFIVVRLSCLYSCIVVCTCIPTLRVGIHTSCTMSLKTLIVINVLYYYLFLNWYLSSHPWNCAAHIIHILEVGNWKGRWERVHEVKYQAISVEFL